MACHTADAEAVRIEGAETVRIEGAVAYHTEVFHHIVVFLHTVDAVDVHKVFLHEPFRHTVDAADVRTVASRHKDAGDAPRKLLDVLL